MSRVPVLVLVGPAAVGKSTVGGLVARALGVPFVDLDEVGARYYDEVGWSIDRLVARSQEIGRVAAEREWEPARAHAVRRAVEEHPATVLALGAGHTSYTTVACRELVRRALAPVPHVVLLLPSADRERALTELRRRSLATKGTDWVVSGHDLLAEWLDDAGTRSVVTDTVVTDGDGPRSTARRLVALVSGAGHQVRTVAAGE